MDVSDEVGSPPAGTSDSDRATTEMYYARYSLDDSSSSDGSRSLEDLEFSANSLDYRSLWDELDRDQEDEVDDDEYQEQLLSIVRGSNQQDSSSVLGDHHYFPRVPEDELFEELIEDQKYFVYPQEATCLKNVLLKLQYPTTATQKSDEGSSPGSSSDGPEPPVRKKLKVDNKRSDRERKSSSSESSSSGILVFVTDTATNQKKFISIAKGEELPEGFELASIKDDFSKVTEVPQELSTAQLGAIQGAIRNTTASSQPTTPAKLSSNVSLSPVTQGKNNASTSSEKSKKLTSLQDLMENESRAKNVATSSSAKAGADSPPDDQPGSSRITYKNRAYDPKTIANIVNSTIGKEPSQKNKASDLEIIPIAAPKRNSNGQAITNPGSFKITGPNTSRTVTVTPRLMTKTAKPPMTVKESPFQPQTKTQQRKVSITSSSSASSPSFQEDPLAVSTKTTGSARPIPIPPNAKVPVLLTCKICQWNFTCYNDSLFKKHVFVKHGVEITDDKYMDECRVYKESLQSCSNCRVLVLNKPEEHRLKCQPSVPKEYAFQVVEAHSKNFRKHRCGLCGNSFSARYELSAHLEQFHSAFNKNIIVDPTFRCSACLKRFEDSLTLTKHIVSCHEIRPAPATIMELARSFLDCDFCVGKIHTSIAEASKCYLNKGVIRCVICLAMFKDKTAFFKHLHLYHGFNVGGKSNSSQPKLTLPCPMCLTVTTGKYQDIFPHVLEEHYQPTLDTLARNAALTQPSSQQPRRPIIFQNRPRALIAAPTGPGVRPSIINVQQGRAPTSVQLQPAPPRLINMSHLASSPVGGNIIISRASTPTIISPQAVVRPHHQIIKDATGQAFVVTQSGIGSVVGTSSNVTIPGLNVIRNPLIRTTVANPRFLTASPIRILPRTSLVATSTSARPVVVVPPQQPRIVFYNNTSAGSTTTTPVIKTGIPSAGVVPSGSSASQTTPPPPLPTNRPKTITIDGRKLDLSSATSTAAVSTPPSPNLSVASTSSIATVDCETLSTESANSRTSTEESISSDNARPDETVSCKTTAAANNETN